MNQFFIPRPFFKLPKAMEVLELLELYDEKMWCVSILLNYRIFVMQFLKMGKSQNFQFGPIPKKPKPNPKGFNLK